MKCTTLIFQAPTEVRLESTPIPKPEVGQLLVATEVSAISAGTEMLVYRGQVPSEMGQATGEVGTLREGFAYPSPFGYCAVGRVIEGDRAWMGRRVFAFQPHQSHFVASPDELIEMPHQAKVGVFLPNLESAINFVQDAAPLLGERVLVIGQGVLGLLTTALLARFPLEQLVTLDPMAERRRRSALLGAESLAPGERDLSGQFDLVLELSGRPEALNLAISACRFHGRVVIGSWYGSKPCSLELGGCFHRNRITLISSQVSTLEPSLSGRWDKNRRLQWACQSLGPLAPQQFITHRFALEDAAQAYQLLNSANPDVLQVVLHYPAC